MEHFYHVYDPLLGGADAAAMVELCHRYGTYRTYAEEPTFPGLPGEGLPARYDAVRNFLRTGGRFARNEPLATLAHRTNYFRETYAYGDEVRISGIEPFLHHAGFVEAACELFGRPVIVPAIVYANLLIPGQELAVHSDVPEFRGANRLLHPQWLLVAMHHSGLFDEWRIPIATGVAWFHDCRGGEFAFYPHGAQSEPTAIPARYNTAVLLDTDSVFHGVDRVHADASEPAPVEPGTTLSALPDSPTWELRAADTTLLASYDWSELRFSISWKAYCFRDAGERHMWERHGNDLRVEDAIQRLIMDLRDRGRIGVQDVPGGRELVELIIDEYVHFPADSRAA